MAESRCYFVAAPKEVLLKGANYGIRNRCFGCRYSRYRYHAINVAPMGVWPGNIFSSPPGGQGISEE